MISLPNNGTFTIFLRSDRPYAPDGCSCHKKRPNGSGPWATLVGAREALRKLRADGNLAGLASVLIQNGTYQLTEPIAFGPEDSQTTFAAAPGASPVFDGGRVLSAWTETTHGKRRAWTLDLPEVVTGHLYFRSLFVSGQRRPRARYPKFSPDAHGGENTLRISG